MYKLYLASDSTYRGDQFFLLNQLVNFNHEVIHICWSQDLKESEEVLAFSFGEHTVTAKHAEAALTREGFQAMLVELKKSFAGQCSTFRTEPLNVKNCYSACHYSTTCSHASWDSIVILALQLLPITSSKRFGSSFHCIL